MSEDRAERAFREALHREASQFGVEPLDPADFKGQRAWTRWPATAAAAAIIVIAAVLMPTMLTTPGGPLGSGPAMTGTQAEPAQERAEDAAPAPASAEAPAQAPAEFARPTPEAGFRWESYRDVMIQVPESWGYAAAPGTDWCVDPESLPVEPYVDTGRGNRPVASISCTERFPANRVVMHLAFAPRDGPEPWHPESASHQVYRRQFGSALVTVTAPAAQADLASRILDSAVVVEIDHNGCLVRRPEIADQVSWEGTPAEVLAVCLYDNGSGWLISSRTLAGPDATAVWEAVLAAPVGGGPEGTGRDCAVDDPGPASVVLGWNGAQSVFRFTGCTGNGLGDAGVEGGLRRVTPELCRALLKPPVSVFAGVGPAAEVCLAASRIP